MFIYYKSNCRKMIKKMLQLSAKKLITGSTKQLY